jgi:hypothetical protein
MKSTRPHLEGSMPALAFATRAPSVDAEPPTLVDPPRVHDITEKVALAPQPCDEQRSRKGPALIDEVWKEPSPRERRPLPTKAIIGIGCAVFVVVVPAFLAWRRPWDLGGAPKKDPEDTIVSADDLDHRRWVSPFDFARMRPTVFARPTEAPAPGATAPEDEVSLSERRRLRADDPEDLVAQRTRRVSTSREEGGAPAPVSDEYRRPFVYFEPSRTPGVAKEASTGLVASAGTLVPVTLSTPVEFRGGGTVTVVATADREGPVPKGARFIGTASSGGEDRFTLRFSRLLLPDGQEAKIEGEGQDETGAFGVTAEAEPRPSGSAR